MTRRARRLVAVLTGVAAVLAILQCGCVPEGFSVAVANATEHERHHSHDCCPVSAGAGEQTPSQHENHSGSCSHCGPNAVALTKGDPNSLSSGAVPSLAVPHPLAPAMLGSATLLARVMPADRSPPGQSFTLVALSCCLII